MRKNSKRLQCLFCETLKQATMPALECRACIHRTDNRSPIRQPWRCKVIRKLNHRIHDEREQGSQAAIRHHGRRSITFQHRRLFVKALPESRGWTGSEYAVDRCASHDGSVSFVAQLIRQASLRLNRLADVYIFKYSVSAGKQSASLVAGHPA
jgi:hypothetical protein